MLTDEFIEKAWEEIGPALEKVTRSDYLQFKADQLRAAGSDGPEKKDTKHAENV